MSQSSEDFAADLDRLRDRLQNPTLSDARAAAQADNLGASLKDLRERLGELKAECAALDVEPSKAAARQARLPEPADPPVLRERPE